MGYLMNSYHFRKLFRKEVKKLDTDQVEMPPKTSKKDSTRKMAKRSKGKTAKPKGKLHLEATTSKFPKPRITKERAPSEAKHSISRKVTRPSAQAIKELNLRRSRRIANKTKTESATRELPKKEMRKPTRKRVESEKPQKRLGLLPRLPSDYRFSSDESVSNRVIENPFRKIPSTSAQEILVPEAPNSGTVPENSPPVSPAELVEANDPEARRIVDGNADVKLV
ncbi:uncharacterized protein LOC129959107 [Argiope bruennichi]|uniref:uncharacterized protein LOC129959107 n=1 Tax=Argiope bruennichi TaxID=94029 RepID=UPI002493EBA2|nr:uncharacterized protein LOC129959107 [Argiope bruennichi]